MRRLPTFIVSAALTLTSPALAEDKATVVLVHGAFAGSSSWSAVIRDLDRNGFRTIAAANPCGAWRATPRPSPRSSPPSRAR